MLIVSDMDTLTTAEVAKREAEEEKTKAEAWRRNKNRERIREWRDNRWRR